MKKRGMAIVALTCMLIASLAGCSNTTETQSTTSSATTETKSTEADDETTASTESTTEAATSAYGPDQYSYMLEDNGYITDVVASDVIELPDFATITFSRAEDFAPSDDEVEAYITYFLAIKSLYNEITDRAIEDGDTVNIDYSGSIDGEVFDGGTATDQLVTAGSDSFIDDFLTQIIGHMPGETFDVNVTFPDDYSTEDLAGKDAVFVVTINYIQEYMEFNDALVASHQDEISAYFGSSLLTADAVRDYIRDYVTEANESDTIEEYIYANIALKDGAEIPDNASAYALMSVNMNLISNYGYSISQLVDAGYYTQTQMDVLVLNEAKYALFCQAIAETQGWTFTDEDMVNLTGTDENDVYVERFGKGYMYRMMIYQKAENYILENITITD